jgi:3-oxo-5-alpha-steroid 4-dehydrogenase 3
MPGSSGAAVLLFLWGRWLELADRLVLPAYAGLSLLAPLSLTDGGWWERLASHGKTLERFAGGAAAANRKKKGRGSPGGPVPGARSRLQRLQDELFRPDGWFYVSKTRFAHFYLVGLLQLLGLVAFFAGSKAKRPSPLFRNADEILLLGLVGAHLVRRLVECRFVHAWSSGGRHSRMHVAGYLLGILHYLLLPLALWPLESLRDRGGAADPSSCAAAAASAATADAPRGHGAEWARRLARVGCAALGAWAQRQQHRHHVLLARLRPRGREGGDGGARYGIPAGGWFRWVSCPHYLAEIIIYASFASLAILGSLDRGASEGDDPATAAAERQGRVLRSCVLLVWVADNLVVSALRSHRWYLDRFPTEYPRLNRRAIVPLLL